MISTARKRNLTGADEADNGKKSMLCGGVGDGRDRVAGYGARPGWFGEGISLVGVHSEIKVGGFGVR